MRKMTKRELRETQIGILDFFVDVCEKNNLKYWLDYGTLLGAVRHKGFIPWDDDIDVSMLREDYDKLISISQDINNGHYKFLCVENDPYCIYPMGKMIDNNTVLYEIGENGIETGVYIDVFVYDNAPLDENTRNKAYNKLDYYGRMRKYQLPWRDADLSIKRVCALLKKRIISVLPKQYYTKKIIESAKKYRVNDTGYVYLITDPYYYDRIFVDKSLFVNQTELSFEGKKYKVPLEYDKWLKMTYGDYMIIPSLEEQKARQHDINAFYKE